jgi:hypothetical protein
MSEIGCRGKDPCLGEVEEASDTIDKAESEGNESIDRAHYKTIQ